MPLLSGLLSGLRLPVMVTAQSSERAPLSDRRISGRARGETDQCYQLEGENNKTRTLPTTTTSRASTITENIQKSDHYYRDRQYAGDNDSSD